VFPELASSIILSFVSKPCFSAKSIILYAILSFIEPPILNPSSFAKTFMFLEFGLSNLITGVFPIKSKILVTG